MHLKFTKWKEKERKRGVRERERERGDGRGGKRVSERETNWRPVQ